MASEVEPFLGEYELRERKGSWNTKRRPLKDILHPLILHFALVIAYTVVFFVAFHFKSSCAGPPTSLHPISNLTFRYVPMIYTDFELSPFAGPPSPAVDKAWHDLLAKTAIRVRGSELQNSNQTSISLPAGGGYMAWLGVYHQLHCIKMLRQWNYREHYHPGLKEEEMPHWEIHADHCLDVLRSAAMCHADTTLTTFGWADQAQPMLNTRPIEHRCVDWDALMDSVESRIVEHEEVAALVNPKLNTSDLHKPRI